jgi:hypothetical protein
VFVSNFEAVLAVGTICENDFGYGYNEYGSE